MQWRQVYCNVLIKMYEVTVILLCHNHIAWLDFILFCSSQAQSKSNSHYLCYLHRWPLKKEDKENKLCGRLSMWFVILRSCEGTSKKKKKLTSAPTLVLFQRCHSFKDWCLQTLQKSNAAPWQPVSHSLNVNKSEIIHDPSLECQLINEIARLGNHTAAAPACKIVLFICISNRWPLFYIYSLGGMGRLVY